MLDGRREGFAWVGRLGGSEADEFGSGKGEGCRDKNGAKAFEAVVECARVVPVTTTDISPARSATAVENDSEDASHHQPRLVDLPRKDAYMKPMTAMTLMIENTNSASP